MYPIALSIFHTSFNVINTLILIGLTPFIAKVATLMVPHRTEDDEEFSLKYINSGLFSTSELSIIQARKEVTSYGFRVEKMFSLLQNLMNEAKPKRYYKLLGRIQKFEELSDDLELEIAAYLTNISEGEISHESSKKIRAMLKIIDDLESIGDVVFSLSNILDETIQIKNGFSSHQKSRLNEMFELLRRAFAEMNRNLEKGFKDVYIENAYIIEEQINQKRNQLRQQHVEDLKAKRYNLKIGTLYSEMFSLSERIGDYIINVSEAIIEYQDAA